MPTPADDPQVSDVGLPRLVRCGRFVAKLVGYLDHDEGWVDDQIMRFEEPISRGFGHKVALGVDEPYR